MARVSDRTQKFDGALLKGDMVRAAGKLGIAGVIADVRDSPKGFGAPFIIDFDTEILPGVTSWSVNVTESRKLQEQVSDETDDWKGVGVVLQVVRANNPKTDEMCDSLSIAKIIPAKEAAKARKSKPGVKSTANGKPVAAKFNPDECPF